MNELASVGRERGPGPTPPRALSFAVFGFVVVGVLLSASERPIHGDGGLMCATAAALIDDGTLSLRAKTRGDVLDGAKGGFYTNYPLLGIAQCVPATLLARAGQHLSGDRSGLELFLTGVVPAVVTGLMAVGFFLLARRMDASPAIATVTTLALVFASPCWQYGRLLYTENLQATVLLFTILVWLRPPSAQRAWRLVLGGVMLGLCVHTKTPLVIMVVAVVVYQLSFGPSIRYLLKAGGLATLGGLPFVALLLWYNQLRFDEAFSLGYEVGQAGTIGFGTPLLTGAHGLLFGAGKSIFIYAPLLLLGLFGLAPMWRAQPRLTVFMAIPTVVLFIAFAKWWAWSGDWSWGPRLIIPLFPFFFVPVLYALRRPAFRRWIAGPLIVLGLVVNLLGISVNDSHYVLVVYRTLQPGLQTVRATRPVRDDVAPLHFIPEMSPPIGHYWLIRQHMLGRWSPDDWYPWRSIGIPAWEVKTDPRPPDGFNFWFDHSLEAWCITAAMLALLLVLGAWLAIAIFLPVRVRGPTLRRPSRGRPDGRSRSAS